MREIVADECCQTGYDGRGKTRSGLSGPVAVVGGDVAIAGRRPEVVTGRGKIGFETPIACPPAAGVAGDAFRAGSGKRRGYAEFFAVEGLATVSLKALFPAAQTTKNCLLDHDIKSSSRQVWL